MKTKKKPPTLKEHLNVLLEEPQGAPIDPVNPSPLPLEVQNISLDMKVDSYLMKYEKESLPTTQNYAVPGTNLGMQFEAGFKAIFRKLLEAEGDDPAAEDPAGDDVGFAGDGGDAGGGDTLDPAAAAPTAPNVENPRFNVGNFAQSVARLVMNYEGLLDPRTTILNRARAYVEKNYDAGIAKQMMEVLASQFDLSPRETQETAGPIAPPAAGAWTGVGGGGG